jgi:peptide/nickel transport system ATP-binding protein
MTLILITHDLSLAQERCDDILVMYAGAIVERGPAQAVFANPAHPYTRALRQANPPVDFRLERIVALAGSVPRASDEPGCPFAPRCPLAEERCRDGVVPTVSLTSTAPGATDTTTHDAVCYRAPLARDDDERCVAPPAVPPTPVAPLLRVVGLVKQFPGAREPAVNGVSLEVRPGECVGIVGESGSGKTTVARCIVGLEKPAGGTIEILGPNGPHRPGPRDVQIVFQDPYAALNPALRIQTMLREAARVGPRPQRTTAELLQLVGLPPEYARRRTAQLSGGERQRIAIAMALAVEPRLLVCDESVSALDVSVQAQILLLLGDLRTRLGTTVLFISHDLAVIRQIADRIYVMHHGTIVEHGDTDAVLGAPSDPYTRRLMASIPGGVQR